MSSEIVAATLLTVGECRVLRDGVILLLHWSGFEGRTNLTNFLANLNYARLAHGCDRAQFREDFRWNLLVHVDDADGFV
jgi:hypothetical protein